MDTVELLLGNEMFLNLAVGVVASVWTAIKASEWRRRVKDKRFSTAIDAVELGVRSVYESYVRELKAGRDDGKLTAEERAEARRRATSIAMDWGLEHGVDVVREVGHGAFDLAIERVLAQIKG